MRYIKRQQLGHYTIKDGKLSIRIDGVIDTTTKNAIQIPVGATSDRPSTSTFGMIRYNTDTNQLESYDTVGWASLAGTRFLVAGTDTAIASVSTGTSIIWNTSTLQSVTNRGSITSNQIIINTTTDATYLGNGALAVAGGVSVGNTAIVGGKLMAGVSNANYAVINGGSSGTAVSLVSTGTDQSINIQLIPYNGKVEVVSTLSSTITMSNNALMVDGGVSASTGMFNGNVDVEGNLWVKGSISGFVSATITQVYGSNGVFIGNTGTGLNALSAGVSGYTTVTNSIFQSSGNVNGYIQNNFQNINSGNQASTDWVATADNGTDTVNYIDLGITGSAWNGSQSNSLYNALGANDGYLYVQGGTGGGNLVIGTTTAGKVVKFNVGGTGTNSIVTTMNAPLTESNSTASGAIVVRGGVGISQNVYVGGMLNVTGRTTFSDSVIFNGTTTYVLSTNTVYTDNILELHTTSTGVQTEWTFDDGNDIGLKSHYFNRVLNTGTSAALVLSNTSQMLEWFVSGAESAGKFTGSYGGFKTGNIQLTSSTAATSTLSGALIVAGGVGIGGSLYAGTMYSNGSRVGDYANTATNMVGGVAGSIPIQSGTGLSSFISTGSVGQLLQMGTNTATWVSTGTISVFGSLYSNTATFSTNVNGGAASRIVYQTAANATGFIATPTIASSVLQWNGSTFSWSSTSSLAVLNDTSTNVSTYYPTMISNTIGGNTSTVYVSSTNLYYNPSLGQLNATSFNSLSDLNKKDNIETVVDAIEKVNALRGVTFDWKESGKPSIGVIAQEVETILPEVVSTTEQGVKSVNYSAIIGVLIEAIKSQQVQINELKGRVS